MDYYALINKIDDDFVVTFPQFPTISTYGKTLDEALINAEEALNGCIESDFERGFEIPEPKIYNENNCYKIKIRPHIEIAIKLRKLRQNKSQIELANKLGISYQAYQRLENPRKCNPTIKTLEKIAKALDKELEVILQ
jgi:antitoxin HicB